jgi:hypothetical protein
MDIVLHDLYLTYVHIGTGSGAGQQLHDTNGACRAAFALIDTGFLIRLSLEFGLMTVHHNHWDQADIHHF